MSDMEDSDPAFGRIKLSGGNAMATPTRLYISESAATIHYSADGHLYHVTRDGCESRFWFDTEPVPGHADEIDQTAAIADGRVLLNVTTKDGVEYCRSIHGFEVSQIEPGRCEPIDDADPRVKDYALFHRWNLAA